VCISRLSRGRAPIVRSRYLCRSLERVPAPLLNRARSTKNPNPLYCDARWAANALLGGRVCETTTFPLLTAHTGGTITYVIVVSMTKASESLGQKLWLSVYHADQYCKQAVAIEPPVPGRRVNPERITQKWLQGMSGHFKANFPKKLRQGREDARLTQHELPTTAVLSVTGLAMSEAVSECQTLPHRCTDLLGAGCCLRQCLIRISNPNVMRTTSIVHTSADAVI